MVVSTILELILFSIPSSIYMTARARRGHGWDASAVMGLRLGSASGYLAAVGVFLVTAGLGYAGFRGVTDINPLRALPSGRVGVTAGLDVTTEASTGAGYVAVLFTTLGEEMLFRGFIAGLLVRRLGFRRGNMLQAVLFLLPHTLLLLVSRMLWPILPAQLIGGWLLGWLRHRSRSIAPGWLAHAATNILAPTLFAL